MMHGIIIIFFENELVARKSKVGRYLLGNQLNSKAATGGVL